MPLVDAHVFADESKARHYTMAAVALSQTTLDSARRELRALRAGGQRALHFKNESPRRRRIILAAIAEQGWLAQVVQSEATREHDARPECLEFVVDLAQRIGASKLTLELDESVVQRDRRELFRIAQSRSLSPGFSYDLAPRSAEPGLWAADAIAWSFVHGGEWRQRIEGMLMA